jgi:hypothetical protein
MAYKWVVLIINLMELEGLNNLALISPQWGVVHLRLVYREGIKRIKAW